MQVQRQWDQSIRFGGSPELYVSSWIRKEEYIYSCYFYVSCQINKLKSFFLSNKMSQEALIIVDIQNDYFPDGKLPTFQPVQTAEACAQLIKKFRAEEKEVVFIKHIVDEAHRESHPFFIPGSHGAEIHDLVKPLPSEKIIVKHQVSAFVNTDLKEYLVSKGVKKLIVVGMMIHNCVNATVYSGVDEGFHCIVVEEAANTMDQKLHDKVIKAEQIKESFLTGIQFVYSKVYKLQDVLDDNFTYEK